jgi:hypothetical protein
LISLKEQTASADSEVELLEDLLRNVSDDEHDRLPLNEQRLSPRLSIAATMVRDSSYVGKLLRAFHPEVIAVFVGRA